MLIFDKAAVAQALDWPTLIEALRDMFLKGCVSPVRHHHHLQAGNFHGTLLLMPAWSSDGYLGVKVANVFPQNSAAGQPAVSACYLLFSAKTGQSLALIDGSELTSRRTAAASALAADYLARKDASRLLIVGTGKVAACLAHAHSAIRPIEKVDVWGRSESNAAALCAELRVHGIEANVADNLQRAVSLADIVSCATLSSKPLFSGALLSPGTHLDLVGGFTPLMREADDEAITRSSVFVDTRGGATAEAGDIVIPMRDGILTPERIRGDLHELVAGTCRARSSASEITLFKSVGAALEDLAAGIVVYESRAA
jgi:ornithine cyclodeaminase